MDGHAQRTALEATFRHVEADGSIWIYHLSLVGEGSGAVVEQNVIDATHEAYARRTKQHGWEEFEPKFLLIPDHIKSSMIHWAQTGEQG